MNTFKNQLMIVDNRLQVLIDNLKLARQNASVGDKQKLSYISKKVDMAAKAIGMALERIER